MIEILVEKIPGIEPDQKVAEILPSLDIDLTLPVACVLDGREAGLNAKIGQTKKLGIIDKTDLAGYWVYSRSVSFLFILAVKELYPQARVQITHAINNEISGFIHNAEVDYDRIEEKMWQIVLEDTEIEKVRVPKERAYEIFEEQGFNDKIILLDHAVDYEEISLTYSRGQYDYFYGPMVPSFGYIDQFSLVEFEKDFLLLLPRMYSPDEKPRLQTMPKLRAVYKEMGDWVEILGVENVGSLNKKVEQGKLQELILVSEGLHEKKISFIADQIKEHIKKTKIILIAGPSSSGKTTFSNRLGIQLRVLGLEPKAIAMDDYFLSRDQVVKGGKEMMESIQAVDIKGLQEDLLTLLSGGEIKLRVFDFIEGKQKKTKESYALKENSILIVEGIHGLNELSTSLIEKEAKYKIYVSALTPLNLDDHNSIYVSDLRLMRRIVRDHRTRGRSAIDTLGQWKHVRQGEEKNVFPYQEQADIMFNSTLPYEMIILKEHLLPLLQEIPEDHETFLDAKRLIRLLRFFEGKTTDVIPKNSILSEFIGGSCFNV